MKIVRDGKEYALTEDEMYAAQREFRENWMKEVLKEDFGCDEEKAEDLACAAYERYAEGNGETEYEAVEWAFNEFSDDYKDAEDDNDEEERFDGEPDCPFHETP